MASVSCTRPQPQKVKAIETLENDTGTFIALKELKSLHFFISIYNKLNKTNHSTRSYIHTRPATDSRTASLFAPSPHNCAKSAVSLSTVSGPIALLLATWRLMARIACGDPAASIAGAHSTRSAASTAPSPSRATASARPRPRASGGRMLSPWSSRRSAAERPMHWTRRALPPRGGGVGGGG